MASYESGKYRNVFKELGIPEEEINQRINDAFNTFFYDENEKVYYTVDDMGYMVDTGNIDVRTEGMSYGMMI